MPGGALHKPIWAPYGLYGTVDHNYGFKAYNAGVGWTAAQGSVNALETIAYMAYLYILYKYGEQEPRQGSGAPDGSMMGQFRALSESRTLSGRMATWAVLLGYTTAQVTFWKTMLYYLNEAFSGKHSSSYVLNITNESQGFDNIGHNSLMNLIFLWIIPKYVLIS